MSRVPLVSALIFTDASRLAVGPTVTLHGRRTALCRLLSDNASFLSAALKQWQTKGQFICALSPLVWRLSETKHKMYKILKYLKNW